MGRIFVIANQKGGVGKTSVAVNLAASMAHYGRRVLLVDLDPQGNATTGSGVDKGACERTVYGVLLGEYAAAEAIRPCEGGYDIVPANRDLAGAEVELIAMDDREYRLRDALAPAAAGYDFVVIDCPPALNMLTVNGFAAADAVIIPMQCEYYALEGLSDLVGTLRKVKQNLNPRIEIEALVRTMYDPRSTLTVQVSDELKRHYGGKVFDTVIPRNIRIAEAPSFGKPVLLHDPSSKGAVAHLQFARELLGRNGFVVEEEPARAATRGSGAAWTRCWAAPSAAAPATTSSRSCR
ncbi:MAG TPA: ParA family protein [Myxococcota bacterium]|nr:ParA family protein [Myxococcota bacterium]